MNTNIYLLSEQVNSAIDSLRALAFSKLTTDACKLPRTPNIMFGVLNGDSRLGYYEPSQDLIVLSEDFLDESVKEIRDNVFLHELAHFVDYHRHGSSAHDKTFREVCGELGVDPDYSGAVVKEYIAKKEKMQAKVDKLMALSASDFEGESESAIAKAKQLMEQYNLKYISEEPSNEIFGIDVYESGRMDVWRTLLMSVVSDITGAFRLIHHTINGKKLSFYGSREQCESALYLWEHFVFNIEQEFSKIKKAVAGKIRPAEIHNGIVQGLHSKVRMGSCKALALSIEKNEQLYCSVTGARISHTSSRINTGSQYAAGKDAGSGISVPTGKGTLVRRIGYNG